jgi:hypothetical protein
LELAVSLEDVAEQNDEVRPLRLDLFHPGRQPPFTKQGSEVHVGQTDDYCSVHLSGKAGKPYLIALYHWRPEALEKRDRGKCYASEQGPTSKGWRQSRYEEAKRGDEVYCNERNENQEKHTQPVHAQQFKHYG